jgi:hypothetical protein
MKVSFVTKENIFYGVKFIAITAIVALLIYQARADLGHVWMIPIYLVVGYLFGKLTCGTHSKWSGFWLTISIFVGLNFIHSMIDGIALQTIATGYRMLGVYSHELIRQPALYVVVWAMLGPFQTKRTWKVLSAIVAVTGIWIMGISIGKIGGVYLNHIAGLHAFLAGSIFLFIGDIAHHLIDEWHHLRHK